MKPVIIRHSLTDSQMGEALSEDLTVERVVIDLLEQIRGVRGMSHLTLHLGTESYRLVGPQWGCLRPQRWLLKEEVKGLSLSEGQRVWLQYETSDDAVPQSGRFEVSIVPQIRASTPKGSKTQTVSSPSSKQTSFDFDESKGE